MTHCEVFRGNESQIVNNTRAQVDALYVIFIIFTFFYHFTFFQSIEFMFHSKPFSSSLVFFV